MRSMGKLMVLVMLGALAFLTGRYAGLKVRTQEQAVLAVTPDGACVYVDGRFAGCSRSGKALLSGIAAGRHLVRVVSQGYVSVHKVIDFGAKQPEPVALDRQPTACLEVISEPAGATVIVDGHVRGSTPLLLDGLPPGSSTVEVAKVNYRTHVRSMDLVAGRTGKVKVRLKHRQVQVYKARIRKDPGDIQAYNDLGELLYVIGRYQEAADAFVRGFVATGKYGSRDEPNRRNTGKLRREARGKHPDRTFQNAFFKAVVKSVSDGKVSPLLLNELKSIPANLYRKERIQALEKLVAGEPKNTLYRFTLMEQQLYYRDFGGFAAEVEKFIKLKSRSQSDFIRMWQILSNAYSRSRGRDRARIMALSKRVLKEADPVFKSGSHAGEYLHEQSRIAGLEGKKDLQKQYLEQALKTRAKGRLANSWRVELARLYLGDRKYGLARQHLEKAAKSRDRRDPSMQRARRMLRDLQRRERMEMKRREKELRKKKLKQQKK